MSHIDNQIASHINLSIIKAADARRGPLEAGVGFRERLWQAITLYRAFREQQSAVAVGSAAPARGQVPSHGTETSSRR